jgi:hypothetical protein
LAACIAFLTDRLGDADLLAAGTGLEIIALLIPAHFMALRSERGLKAKFYAKLIKCKLLIRAVLQGLIYRLRREHFAIRIGSLAQDNFCDGHIFRVNRRNLEVVSLNFLTLARRSDNLTEFIAVQVC